MAWATAGIGYFLRPLARPAILRNIWLNRLRERRTAPQLVELAIDQSLAEAAVETGKDPYSLLESKRERERVRGAIEQLPRDYREIILLREYEGCRIRRSPWSSVARWER